MQAHPWMLWAAAALLYAGFRLWYDNWRGPVRPREIEAFMARAEALWPPGLNNLDQIRRFLETDDGREFIMVNLIRVRTGDVADPVTGQSRSGLSLLRAYFAVFAPTLIAGGGLPLLSYRKISGYVDPLNVPPDPGWTVAGLMRYRSRRDMMVLATDANFLRAHELKMAALTHAMAFPAQAVSTLVAGPRLAVAMGLALAAALGHLVWLTV
ncbi:hypothetical protein [Brevundimonas sp. R86498]|uniref:hypothetical protein n=1 Tax=Brevundimonas sp. R86498 TaxID=3093845 RepID=UPI0037C899F6